MPPWGSGFRFRKGPLLQSVGLDGTQTVAGLRQLDRSSRSQAAVSALEGAVKGGPLSLSQLQRIQPDPLRNSSSSCCCSASQAHPLGALQA